MAEQDDDEEDARENPAGKPAPRNPDYPNLRAPFKPGCEPGPGRPKGSYSLRQRVRAAMREDPARAQRIRDAFMAILEDGAKGKGQVEAFKLFMQYIEPPPDPEEEGDEPGAGQPTMTIVLEDRREEKAP